MLTTSSFEAESLRIFFEIIPSRMESRSFGLRPPFRKPPREIHISFTTQPQHRFVKMEPSKGGADATVDVDRGVAAGDPRSDPYRGGRLQRGSDARARADRPGGRGRSGRSGLRILSLRAVPVPAVLHRFVPADPGCFLGPAVGKRG